MLGIVKFYDGTKGFGFIEPDSGPDVFVHVSALQAAGIDTLHEGARLQFEVQQDKRGPRAVNLKIVEWT